MTGKQVTKQAKRASRLEPAPTIRYNSPKFPRTPIRSRAALAARAANRAPEFALKQPEGR